MPGPQTTKRDRTPSTFPDQSAPNNLSYAQEHELVTTFRVVEETSRLTEISRKWLAEIGSATDASRDQEFKERYEALVSDYKKHVERFQTEGQRIVARNYTDQSPNERVAQLSRAFSDTVQKLDAVMETLGENPTHHTLKEAAEQMLGLLSERKNVAVSQLRGLVGNIPARDLMWEMHDASASNQSLRPLLGMLEKRAQQKFLYPEAPFAPPGPGIQLDPQARMEILNTAAALQLAVNMGAAFEMRTAELAHPAAKWNTEPDQLGYRAPTPLAYLQHFEEAVGRYRDFFMKASQIGPNGEAVPPEAAAKTPLGQLGKKLGEVSAEMAQKRANLLIQRPNATLFEYSGTFLTDQAIAQNLYKELYLKLSGVLRERGIDINMAGSPNQHLSSAGVDLIDALRKSTPAADVGAMKVIDTLEQHLAKGFPPERARWHQLVLPPKQQ